jgi:hypothetical protein
MKVVPGATAAESRQRRVKAMFAMLSWRDVHKCHSDNHNAATKAAIAPMKHHAAAIMNRCVDLQNTKIIPRAEFTCGNFGK